ncbi:MAG: hypothetical protein IJH34_10470 [Romboutsia sp.]|nr:hypothetical protein [Romboutsia sp.]
MYHRFGFAYKGAETNLITRDEAINKWLENSFMDMHECVDKIIVNEYSPTDIH